MEEYISAAELGRRLGIANSTVISLVDSGKIVPAYVSPTNRLRFSVDSIESIRKNVCKMPDEYLVEDIVNKYGVDKRFVYSIANELGARRLYSRKLCFKKSKVEEYFESEADSRE